MTVVASGSMTEDSEYTSTVVVWVESSGVLNQEKNGKMKACQVPKTGA